MPDSRRAGPGKPNGERERQLLLRNIRSASAEKSGRLLKGKFLSLTLAISTDDNRWTLAERAKANSWRRTG